MVFNAALALFRELTAWDRCPKEVGEGALYLTLNTVHHQNDCSIKVGSGEGMLM